MDCEFGDPVVCSNPVEMRKTVTNGTLLRTFHEMVCRRRILAAMPAVLSIALTRRAAHSFTGSSSICRRL